MTLQIDRSETTFVFTLISGCFLTCVIFILQLLNFSVSTLAAASGVCVALTSVKFYGLIVLVLSGKNKNRANILYWGMLKLASLGVFFLSIDIKSSGSVLSAVLGLLCLIGGAALRSILGQRDSGTSKQ